MKKVILTLVYLFLAVKLSSAFENLDAKTFYDMLQKDKAVLLLDVRTPVEYREDGHIPGSVLIPVQILPQYLKDIEKFKDKKVLVYCRSGNRSAVAARFLEQNGFKQVYNLKDGIIGWKKAGLPVEYK